MDFIMQNHKTKYIQLLEENYDKIYWHVLAFNSSPGVIQLLEQNYDKFNLDGLSKN